MNRMLIADALAARRKALKYLQGVNDTENYLKAIHGYAKLLGQWERTFK